MPLEHKPKMDILQELKIKNIYEYCWFCETPIMELGEVVACKCCTPCKTHFSVIDYVNNSMIKCKSSLLKLATTLDKIKEI